MLNNLALERPLIFFDTETTGTDKINDRIVELSTVKFFPDGKKEIITQRFNPTIPIPAGASEVHGITDADVNDKPSFAAKAAELLEYFTGCDFGGFNLLNFDLPLISEEFLRAGVSLPFNTETKFVDSLKIFHLHERRDLTAAYKFYCDKNLTDAHSAEADAIASAEVFNSQIERYGLDKTIDALHTLCTDGNDIVDYDRKFTRNENGEIVFNFGKHAQTKAAGQPDYLNWMLDGNFSNYTKHICKQILSGELG